MHLFTALSLAQKCCPGAGEQDVRPAATVAGHSAPGAWGLRSSRMRFHHLALKTSLVLT